MKFVGACFVMSLLVVAAVAKPQSGIELIQNQPETEGLPQIHLRASRALEDVESWGPQNNNGFSQNQSKSSRF